MKVLLFLTLLLPCILCKWNWGSIPVGGGGYVLGLLVHPKEQDLIYARTDVGGIYRRGTNEWIPLTERFDLNQKNYYGGESIAIDPQNPNVLYHAAGMYSIWGAGTVFKSNDRGITWEDTHLPLKMGGNEDLRWAGERLAVDPQNSCIVYFGSRYDGLWKYNCDTWSFVSKFPSNGTVGYGVTWVAFDPTKKGSVTTTIYIGVYGSGVFKSIDAGNSWNLIPDSPKEPVRWSLAIDQMLYVSSLTGVYQISPSGVVKNITPPSPLQRFSGITTDPVDPQIVITGEKLEGGWASIYRSYDRGSTWEAIISSQQRSNIVKQSSVPWWTDDMFCASPSSVTIDPHHRERLYITDWYGTWFNMNSTAKPAVWFSSEKGHEEVFGIVLHCPSAGGLLSGTADVDGFKHDSISEYPQQFQGLRVQDTNSIDSADLNPSFVVRAGTVDWNNSGDAGYSTDYGLTFTKFPNYPVENNYPIGGDIAVSADSKIIVWRPFLKFAYYSTDVGKTWIECKGAPKSNSSCCHNKRKSTLGIDFAYPIPLAADRVNPQKFYIYDRGQVYISVDGSKTFSNASYIAGYNSAYNVMIKTLPGVEGELWVSTDWAGLWRSTDSGKSFTKIAQLDRSVLFAFGKGKVSTTPALYVMGNLQGKSGIYVSFDLGQTWEDIQDPSAPVGDNPWSMCADQKFFGRVYIGTLGRGLYVGQSPTSLWSN
eukprot:TRINITY_DN3057_c0_g2_i1.p1 TRINITY_DN3057_c0_g2~~TRINITY_DN3057_c0_g2_i1.p1  ORF type:complete len:705 (-),score=136.78 TRINITY_DN3057_c0_g2_i1:31-2145(-)